MNKFDLTNIEDMQLQLSVMLPGRRHSLYEYLCALPLKALQAYPAKGYHWWMGKAARSAQAIALRDYILHWRIYALTFRQKYSREYLKTLSADDLRSFLRAHITKIPIWAYEGPIKDALQILFQF